MSSIYNSYWHKAIALWWLRRCPSPEPAPPPLWVPPGHFCIVGIARRDSSPAGRFKKLSAPGQEFITICEFAKREGCDEKHIRCALEGDSIQE